MKKLAALLCVTLCACAAPPKPTSDHEMSILAREWANCLVPVIKSRDDRISDATTVAAATVGACPREFNEYFEGLTRADNGAVKQQLWSQRSEMQRNFALPLVLQIRRAGK